MRPRILFVIAATAVAALAVPAVPAVAGGGGCHGDATTGEGDTVEIADGCFGPTTLKVDPGETVTFMNLDPYVHNVSAVGWGHLNDLYRGDSFQATFEDAGVYPFACQYHPAMVGAIVVGDGKALAGATPVVSETDTGTDAGTEVRAASTTRASSSDAPTTGWVVVGGAIGVAAGLTIGLVARRGARAKQRDA
jgi:plastocyanin